MTEVEVDVVNDDNDDIDRENDRQERRKEKETLTNTTNTQPNFPTRTPNNLLQRHQLSMHPLLPHLRRHLLLVRRWRHATIHHLHIEVGRLASRCLRWWRWRCCRFVEA